MAAQLEAKLSEIDSFTSGTPVHDVILELVVQLAALPASHTRFMSYKSIANMVGIEPTDKLVIQSVSILTAKSVNILVPMFVYVGAEELEYVMQDKEFAAAKSEGVFVDPVTGVADKEFLRSTYPYFATTEEFTSMQSQA